MKALRPLHFLAAASAALHFTACSKLEVTHVPPGKSARSSLAQRDAGRQGIAGALPPGALPAPAGTTPPNHTAEMPLPQLPSGDVSIPSGNSTGEKVADSYSRGTFAMQAGQDAEAVTALEETVKLDPDFTDAWGKLAILYQKNGQSAKATDAFKRAKRLGDANGGTVSRDAIGGLQIP